MVSFKNHEDLHGCNNHPSKEFLKKKQFLKIIKTDKLNFLTKKLLNSEEVFLSPRMIVRSFSKLSTRCTFAHRDKEYFECNNSKNVMTCWIPLGPTGKEYGQLIYLADSHKKEKLIDNLVEMGKYFQKIWINYPKIKSQWFRPIMEEGELFFIH